MVELGEKNRGKISNNLYYEEKVYRSADFCSLPCLLVLPCFHNALLWSYHGIPHYTSTLQPFKLQGAPDLNVHDL